MKNAIDLTKILTKAHEQKWVALSRDHKKVIGFSEDLVKLKKKVGETKVVYMKVPASGRSYAF